MSLALLFFEGFPDSFVALHCVGTASVISHGVHKTWKDIAVFGAAGRS